MGRLWWFINIKQNKKTIPLWKKTKKDFNFQNNILLFVPPNMYSKTANPMVCVWGRSYKFVWPMKDRRSVQETCLTPIIFFLFGDFKYLPMFN